MWCDVIDELPLFDFQETVTQATTVRESQKAAPQQMAPPVMCVLLEHTVQVELLNLYLVKTVGPSAFLSLLVTIK